MIEKITNRDVSIRIQGKLYIKRANAEDLLDHAQAIGLINSVRRCDTAGRDVKTSNGDELCAGGGCSPRYGVPRWGP